MKKMVCFLTVLSLLAFVGCKEKAVPEQKPVVDTTKVVAPAPEKAAVTAPAPAAKPADTTKNKKK